MERQRLWSSGTMIETNTPESSPTHIKLGRTPSCRRPTHLLFSCLVDSLGQERALLSYCCTGLSIVHDQQEYGTRECLSCPVLSCPRPGHVTCDTGRLFSWRRTTENHQ